MALIDKIFSKKGNRQFTKDEDTLIDALNNANDFIADEAYINFTHTELFAIDKELGKFLKITLNKDELLSQVIAFENVTSYESNIKDRANEEWMENFSKWKTQKKFIRSISILIESGPNEKMTLYFTQSENNDGDRVASIPVKRALFSMEKWDNVLYRILVEKKDKDFFND
jgi:hypothetical protein|tara:strand:+ start:1124 stop:1636 length:513 start_codon:yes stop_codon:yes gene_type:complete